MPRTNSAEPAIEHVGFLLAKAAQRYNEILAAGFAARGFGEVRPSYGSVLVPLFECDGQRLGELGAAARLSKQAMTGLVKQCESDGLVERARDATDGRAFTIRLTARGRAFRSAALEVAAEADAALVKAVGARDRDALVRALKGMMDL